MVYATFNSFFHGAFKLNLNEDKTVDSFVKLGTTEQIFIVAD